MNELVALKPRGRPVEWDRERIKSAMDHILVEVASGRSVRRILMDDEGMPSAAKFWNWVSFDVVLKEKLAQAREFGVEAHLDDALAIADNSNADACIIINPKSGEPEAKIDGEAIQRSKLRVETRLRYAAMIAPKKYGDKIDVTSAGEALQPAMPAVAIDARVQTIVMLAQSRRDAEEEARRLLED